MATRRTECPNCEWTMRLEDLTTSPVQHADSRVWVEYFCSVCGNYFIGANWSMT